MPGTSFLSAVRAARGRCGAARRALQAAWSTSPVLLLGVAAVSLIRGLIPAGLALSARGIVNGAVAGLHGGQDIGPLLPWLLLGFVLTVLEGVGSLAGPLLRQRLRDELACRLTSDVMAHAATLDLSFFEDPRSQDALQRAKDDPAGHVTSFVATAISACSNALQIGSLVAILVVIEPWVVAVVLALTVPYLWAQWRLTAEQHALERSRTAKRRWTGYFVSSLTGAQSAGEVQLLRLAPLLTGRFRSLMEEFQGQDWRLARRGFGRGTRRHRRHRGDLRARSSTSAGAPCTATSASATSRSSAPPARACGRRSSRSCSSARRRSARRCTSPTSSTS
jgi:ATP-binding cassette subfamily B protein